jgi:hypothetical protein
MEKRNGTWLFRGLFVGLGLSVAMLTWPQSAQGGGLRITIGIPAPVYVAPPPVLVYPAPVLVHPPPHVVYPPPVAYAAPYGVYGRPLPPGLAKKYYGFHPAYGYKFYKYGKPKW